MRLSLFATAVATTFAICACNQPIATSSKTDFLAANIDSATKPGENFFQYANGGWLKNNPIPETEAGWGIGNLVQEDIYSRLRKINETALTSKAAAGTTDQKIGDFWFSGMDSADIEKQGLKPLQADLDKINAIASVNDLVAVAADFHNKGIAVLFSDYAGQDDKNSEVIAYQLNQGGLGMPNRDYYFNTDEKTLNVRKAYQAYLFKTLKQLGNDSAKAVAEANAVYNVESRMAKSARKLADLRDPYKNYNKMNLSALNSMSGNINWPLYLPKIGIKQLDSVIVGQPEFFTNLNSELAHTALADWKNYLRCQLVKSSASYLDKESFNNLFDYNKTLSGAKEPRLRWKRVLDTEERAMGEALGQLFVKEYFNETAKKRYTDLVEAIRDAYKERIQNLPWMSKETKEKALEKLSKVSKK